MAAKNPSSVIFWNDLENDEHLKTCSLAAKGLWDHHMLPIAARSIEPGVIVLGNHPSRLADDLPLLLARAVGEAPDVITILLRELVDSGAASVDDRGRVYNRRMVREEAIRQARSAAGKRGADVTNEKRQKSGKHPAKEHANDGGNGSGEDFGKSVGKIATPETDLSQGATTETSDWQSADVRQTAGEDIGSDVVEVINDTANKDTLSSLLHASYSNDVTATESEADNGTCVPDDPADGDASDQPVFLARTPEGDAARLWNEAAERVGWPKIQRITELRRKALKARLADCGGLDGWRAALGKAEASSFLTGKAPRRDEHASWRCNIDFILKQSKFTKLLEGDYDDTPGNTNGSRSPRPVQSGSEAAEPDGISAAFARRSVLAGR